jgi:hypothetical protein
MKRLLLITTLLIASLTGFGQITSSTPVIKMSPQNQTTDINGGTIEKGDTVRIVLNWKNNSSTIRTMYLDFQHQISALSLLDIQFPVGGSQGSALPTGTQTSFTNNYYPGYFWNNTTNNNTENGFWNAQYASYGFQQTSQRAINRITLNFSTPNGNATNFGDGDLAYLRFKVEQVGAGYSYDSVYLNFAYGWGTNGSTQTIQMPRVNSSSWIDVDEVSNALVNGQLGINSLLSGGYQPKIKVVTEQNSPVSNFTPTTSGAFTVAQQVLPNTWYKWGVYIPSDSLPSVLNKAVTISDYTLALTEWNKQNLDGTFTFQTLASGIAYLAADINSDGKFDGQDLGLMFAQVVGYDTVVVATQGTTEYSLPTFLGNTYDTLSFSSWKNMTSVPTSVLFKTTTTAESLSLKYLIPGDINRSHSSQRTSQGGAQTLTTYSVGDIITKSLNANSAFINTDNQKLSSIDVNLNNVTVVSNNIEIPITVDNKGLSVTAVQFEFVYDPTKVKFEELKSNFPSSWVIFVNSKDDGRIKFVAVDKDLKNPMRGTAPFTLKFSSIGNGLDLGTKIQVTQNMDASDDKGNQLGINLNSQTIKLTGYNKFK